jgi:pimeloyl-ACP methyl ester carboxylesterase
MKAMSATSHLSRAPYFVVMAIAATLLTSCDSGARSTAGSTPTVTVGHDIEGLFDVGDRQLYLRCTGDQSPTIVLEGGEGAASDSMESIRLAYDDTNRVCAYDRANLGQSGAAPTPRTATSLIGDLHSLLEKAQVPGPYLLVGSSAGGLIVQAYARAHADTVAGVVSMNPVPPWHAWSTQGLPAMTEQERQDETGYYAGANPESLDYRDISNQVDATPAPAELPFHLLISTVAQCESPGDVCSRTYPAYERIMRTLTRDWHEGRLTQVAAGHELYVDDPRAVHAAINEVLARAGGTG